MSFGTAPRSAPLLGGLLFHGGALGLLLCVAGTAAAAVREVCLYSCYESVQEREDTLFECIDRCNEETWGEEDKVGEEGEEDCDILCATVRPPRLSFEDVDMSRWKCPTDCQPHLHVVQLLCNGGSLTALVSVALILFRRPTECFGCSSICYGYFFYVLAMLIYARSLIQPLDAEEAPGIRMSFILSLVPAVSFKAHAEFRNTCSVECVHTDGVMLGQVSEAEERELV